MFNPLPTGQEKFGDFSNFPQITELKSTFHGIKILKLRNFNPQITEKPIFVW